MRKKKKLIFTDFKFLGLFMNNLHDLSEEKFPSSSAVAAVGCNLSQRYRNRLKS
jgi:hypothetical protein